MMHEKTRSSLQACGEALLGLASDKEENIQNKETIELLTEIHELIGEIIATNLEPSEDKLNEIILEMKTTIHEVLTCLEQYSM